MSQDTELLVTEVLKPITHPGTNKSIINSISKIIIKNNAAFFTIYADTSSAEELENIKIICHDKLKERCNFEKIAITLSQRTENVETIQPAKQAKVKYSVPNVGKIIVVASGKGGVGKSTIAFNLAVTLSELGYKTGLVDSDIHGPSLPRLAGLKQKPAQEDNYILPLEKFGVEMMSVGFLVNEDDALIWRGPMTTKMLYQLLMMTKWGKLDYLIVDTPPGTGDIHLSLAENFVLDGVVIVSTPQELALADVKKGISMFNKLNVPILGIIENMSFFEDSAGVKHQIFGTNGVKKLASDMNINLLAELPINQDITEASDKGKPLVFYKPDHAFTKAFAEMAQKLVNCL